MAISDWTYLASGTPPLVTFGDSSPIAGVTSLQFDVTTDTSVGARLVRHNTLGNTIRGALRTLFSVHSLSNGSSWGVFGMLQTGTATSDVAYWLYFKHDDAVTLRLARAALTSLDSITPLATATITSLVIDQVYCLELEWQYDALAAAAVLYGKFALGSSFGSMTTVITYPDVVPLTTGVSAGVGIMHANVPGSTNPILKIDTTSIWAP